MRAGHSDLIEIDDAVQAITSILNTFGRLTFGHAVLIADIALAALSAPVVVLIVRASSRRRQEFKAVRR